MFVPLVGVIGDGRVGRDLARLLDHLERPASGADVAERVRSARAGGGLQDVCEPCTSSTVQPERPVSPASNWPLSVGSSNTSPLIVTGANSPKFTVSAWPLSSVIVTLVEDEAT